MVTFHEAQLRQLVARVIVGLGSAAAEANCVAAHLVQANVVGHDSHGVGMLPTYVRLVKDGLLIPNQTLKPVRDAGGIRVFDGGRGFGMSMAGKAVEHTIQAARQLGVCLLVLRNSSHIGRVGAYGEQAATEGCAFVAYVNVADHQPIGIPWGASEARLGTNPFVTAVPSIDGTIALDMATTGIAAGKVRVAHARGLDVVGDYLRDANGETTHDPRPFIERGEGGIRTFGGHKGSGLSVMCELLAGAIGGGQRVDEPTRGGIVNSMLAVVMDLSYLGEAERIQERIATTKRYLGASRRQAPDQPVLLPGEPEAITAAERAGKGVVLDESTWKAVCTAAASVGVELDEEDGRFA